MAIQVSKVTRVFTYKGKDGKQETLQDPNKDLTPTEVQKFYAGTYPQITNAMLEGPVIVGDKATYNFKTEAGKLG